MESSFIQIRTPITLTNLRPAQVPSEKGLPQCPVLPSMGNRRERTHLGQGTWETTFWFAQCCFFLNLVVIIPTSFKGVCMMFGGVCLQQDRSLWQGSNNKYQVSKSQLFDGCTMRHSYHLLFKRVARGCVILICLGAQVDLLWPRSGPCAGGKTKSIHRWTLVHGV